MKLFMHFVLFLFHFMYQVGCSGSLVEFSRAT